MSWALSSLLIVAAIVVAGIAWFERSRPPARMVALVAALAALATIGRIAFAPIPNVKPTSDIAFFAGYALGSVPGFAVGAFAALLSNFFFGQGPWTPWQMLAWGGVGVFGATLRAVAGRGLGRTALAVACAAAGIGFGLVMDAYQWSQGAVQDLPHYLAIEGTSLPFNLAHAAGNVVFCLLLGPSFVRALERYRRRFAVRWEPVVAGLALIACVTALAKPTSAEASPASDAAAYLRAAQNADGGFGPAPGASSAQLHSGWAALGLAAAGVNPLDVRRGGRSVIDYLRATGGQVTQTGDVERTILVLRAAGLPATSFAGRNLVADLRRRRSADGSFGRSINLTAFGMLALRAAGVTSGARSAGWLAAQQGSDGGFGFSPGAASDIDDTAAVIEALGRGNPARRGVRFLRANQNGDGGFGQMPGDYSNAQSTAWAVQGLLAAGADPASVRRRGHTPLGYLASLQRTDGSIRYSRTSSQTPVWVTAEALDALERRAFPIVGVPRSRAAAAHGQRQVAAAPAAPGTHGVRSEARSARPKRASATGRPARRKPRRRTPVAAAPPASAPARTAVPASYGAPAGASHRRDGFPLAAVIAAASAGAAIIAWVLWRSRRALLGARFSERLR